MADIDGVKKSKEFHTGTPQQTPGFFLKGSHQYDWGLKNRLSRVFNPKSGNTLMLAFDHGYFQGPTTGLERVDQTILPLEPYADCLMLTRGIQRSIIPASTQKAIALRASGGRVFGPSGAAARLGIPRSTLESRIRALKIRKSRFRTRESKDS